MKAKTGEMKKKGWVSRILAWVAKGQDSSSVPLCGH